MKMKRLSAVLVIVLLVITGCGNDKQITDDVIVVDIKANYPDKKLGNVLNCQNKFISLQLKIKNDDTPIRNIVSSLPKQ
jgi:hypothetical protein